MMRDGSGSVCVLATSGNLNVCGLRGAVDAKSLTLLAVVMILLAATPTAKASNKKSGNSKFPESEDKGKDPKSEDKGKDPKSEDKGKDPKSEDKGKDPKSED
eukprot:gene20487-27275_t